MAKAEKPEVIQDDFKLSLKEFCTRISSTDRRVELIGGFFAHEKGAGRMNDFESAYKARLENFAKRPA